VRTVASEIAGSLFLSGLSKAGTSEGAIRAWDSRGRISAILAEKKDPFKGFTNPDVLHQVAKKMGIPPEAILLLWKSGQLGVRMARPKSVEPPEAERLGANTNAMPGRCYDAAANYLLENSALNSRSGKEPPAIKLVHGTIEDSETGYKIGHAWAVVGNKVFDGAKGEFYDKADFYRKAGAKEEQVYDKRRTFTLMSEYMHYGPWGETKGVVGPQMTGRRK